MFSLSAHPLSVPMSVAMVVSNLNCNQNMYLLRSIVLLCGRGFPSTSAPFATYAIEEIQFFTMKAKGKCYII